MAGVNLHWMDISQNAKKANHNGSPQVFILFDAEGGAQTTTSRRPLEFSNFSYIVINIEFRVRLADLATRAKMVLPLVGKSETRRFD